MPRDTFFYKEEASGVLFLAPSPREETSVAALLPSGDTSTGSAGISPSALPALANRRRLRSLIAFLTASTCCPAQGCLWLSGKFLKRKKQKQKKPLLQAADALLCRGSWHVPYLKRNLLLYQGAADALLESSGALSTCVCAWARVAGIKLKHL